MKEIEEQIEIVKNDIHSRFPGCHYTIRILMWDDNTTMVECRHGSGDKLHISSYYNGQLNYEEIDRKKHEHGMMMVDEFGNEYYRHIPRPFKYRISTKTIRRANEKFMARKK